MMARSGVGTWMRKREKVAIELRVRVWLEGGRGKRRVNNTRVNFDLFSV